MYKYTIYKGAFDGHGSIDFPSTHLTLNACHL